VFKIDIVHYLNLQSYINLGGGAWEVVIQGEEERHVKPGMKWLTSHKKFSCQEREYPEYPTAELLMRCQPFDTQFHMPFLFSLYHHLPCTSPQIYV